MIFWAEQTQDSAQQKRLHDRKMAERLVTKKNSTEVAQNNRTQQPQATATSKAPGPTVERHAAHILSLQNATHHLESPAGKNLLSDLQLNFAGDHEVH